MSKHNYSQYSNKNVNKAVIDAGVETLEYTYTDETTEPAPVETRAYIEEKADTAAIPNTGFGTVANCVKLNVRVAPNPNATVVCVLDVYSELEIDYDNSTAEWYNVCTSAGIKGYCMRKFITLRK